MRNHIFSACVVLAIFAPQASSNVLVEISLDRQFEESDLVVIGSVGNEEVCDTGFRNYPCVEIIEFFNIKENEFDCSSYFILTDTGISESSIRHLDLSGNLLVFAQQARDCFFEPTNGRYSIRRLIEAD